MTIYFQHPFSNFKRLSKLPVRKQPTPTITTLNFVVDLTVFLKLIVVKVCTQVIAIHCIALFVSFHRFHQAIFNLLLPAEFLFTYYQPCRIRNRLVSDPCFFPCLSARFVFIHLNFFGFRAKHVILFISFSAFSLTFHTCLLQISLVKVSSCLSTGLVIICIISKNNIVLMRFTYYLYHGEGGNKRVDVATLDISNI